MPAQTSPPQAPAPAAERLIEVELLALDLEVCTRCRGTLDHIQTALQALRPALAATGTKVRLTRTLIRTEAEARQHRFSTSPTIRIDGRDLEVSTLESDCESCTELCGDGAGTLCRVWEYRGEQFTEVPVGLVVEALVRATASAFAPGAAPVPYTGVPENLQRFFRGRAGEEVRAACCPPETQETCCAAEAKSSCCPTANPTACGCR